MDAVKDSLADYQTLWGGTREYIDYKWAFPKEFEDEPPRAVDYTGASDAWEVASPEEKKNWPETLRRKWESYHLAKAEALGFKITTEELKWETSGLFKEGRMERWLEEAKLHPEFSMEEIKRRELLKHLKEVAQQPDYFTDCGEEKYVRILKEMGIRKVEG